MIVRLPDGVGSGTTRNGFVETIDIHGTILDAAGCEPIPGADALSVLPLVRGSDDDRLRSDVLAEVHAHYMLRTQRWKIVIGRDGQTMALFDLEKDPLEQFNYCGHPDYGQAEIEMRSRLLGRPDRRYLPAEECRPRTECPWPRRTGCGQPLDGMREDRSMRLIYAATAALQWSFALLVDAAIVGFPQHPS